MGIKKLFTFLNNNNLYKIYPFINDLIQELDLINKNILVGVDGNLFCYKYTYSYDNMLIGFFNQIILFFSNGIIPFYIFDGGTINEKSITNIARYNKKQMNKNKLEIIDDIIHEQGENIELQILKKKFEKNSTKISSSEISKLLELFDLLNIPYIFSHCEGEYLAVLLNQYGIIDMFLSDDTDPIPAGIKKMIKFYNNSVYYLDVGQIYKKLNLTKDEFCDFCILLGTDYSTFYLGCKPIDLYTKIRKYSTIENIINNDSKEEIKSIDIELINRIRKIYKESALNEKKLFLNPELEINGEYNKIIDHNKLENYSNILLEFWDDFIDIFKNTNTQNIDKFKKNIFSFIKEKKFNIKNIVKFLKNNISDINQVEIDNAQITFEYLNTFGL